MQGYSPYAAQKRSPQKWRPNFKLPRLGGGVKRALRIAVGIAIVLFLAVYLSLGDLRFFANHYLRLTFFSKNYLILLQNNYELRPGGGFITAFGNLDTFMGFPTNLSFKNSYEIDTKEYARPPYPHEELLKNEWYQGYTFRDANWMPSFPDSTQDLIGFYRQKFPENDVDGIIVVNFSLIEKWVEALGGIALEEEALTGENLFQKIEFAVNNVDRHDETALTGRKNILGNLATAMMKKAKWHPFKTRSVLSSGLRNKDLYLWLKSPGLQKRVERKNWGNALTPLPDADFLSVNLANLGAKKADRYMQREIHHVVNLTKEVPEVETEVTLRFPGFTNAYSDHYKGYLRVLIPASATVTGSPIDSRVEREGELSVIGTKVVIPAGSKTTLNFSYTLPRTLLPTNGYKLRLARQSGAEADWSVTVETPAESTIESGDFRVRENRATFSGTLSADRDLALTIGPDKSPPYPIEQVFKDLKTVEITWNEPIDEATGNDALNYVIWDTNLKEPLSDAAKVEYAEVNGAVSRLELSGVEKQDLERYKIELKNLRDLAGNTITPNPKTITAVQRFTLKPAATPALEVAPAPAATEAVAE